MTKFYDAFISYGRADSKAFATKLQARLNEQGFKVWFDFSDIPLAVDFQNQIDDGIQKAHHFLFIISPHAVNSPYCHKEIERALQLNKRIIPLLHVMEISQETWQQRNPNGAAEEWDAYKAKALHESYQNMHPTIRQLNWVYFQEGKDDFEQSLANLIALLRSHTDYVRQHTRLLVRALEWEQHQKQTSYLLVGEEKQQAETWLKIHFKDEQPPCLPTDLHCEFITESIKNSDNLMTQVFLSYAHEDKATMEKIRNSLRRESLTVWTNTTDIQTGEAFGEAIERGIEQADNVVYLLSPDAVSSPYCQQELALAVLLHKRIIPILVRETDPAQVPPALQLLHYIDLTDNVKEDDYLLDESQLLKTLHQDEAYYNEHKILLTKALKWQRQQQNPSILLRGYNLRSAETWLKLAQKRKQHPPTALQEEFIAASLHQPPLESLEVFISYSRTDADLARKLNDALQMQGKTTWFDQESIASGSDFQQEIYQGIKACDNFLFILSPRSLNSPYCADEVEYATSLNKRIVTVLHRPIDSNILPAALARVQWIDFNQEQGDFNANFNRLVRTLDTDREHVRSHSKWLRRAIEWQQKGKSVDLLLRGSELAIAQNWMQDAETSNKKPATTPLQKAYIDRSQQAKAAASRREKRQVAILKLMFGVMTGLFLAAAGLSALAWEAQRRAKQNLLDHVNALIGYSKILSDSNQEFDALISAISASNSLQEQSNNLLDILMFGSKDINQAKGNVEASLRRALNGVKELNRIEGQTNVIARSDLQGIATIAKHGKVKLWNDRGQEQKNSLDHGKEKITNIALSNGGDKIITVSGEGDHQMVKVWDWQGKELHSFSSIENFDRINFSPNDKLMFTTHYKGYKKIVKLWRIEGNQLTRLHSNEKFISVDSNKDGSTIVTVSEAGDKQIIKLWDDRGKLRQPFPPIEAFDYMYFSPNGQLIATISWEDDITVKLWRIEADRLTRLHPNEKFMDFDFNEDGSTIATISKAGDKRIIKLWDDRGKLRQSFPPIEAFNYMYFSPNDRLIVTGSWEKGQTIWKIEDERLTHLHSDEKFDKVSFSEDGNQIATIKDRDFIKLWTPDGEELQTLPIKNTIDKVYFSAEGKTIATKSDDTVQFWEIDSSDRTILQGQYADLQEVKLSPTESKFFAIAYNWQEDKHTAKLWRIEEGLEPQPLLSDETLDWVRFSDDGKLIATDSEQGIKLWRVKGTKLQPLLSNKTFSQVQFEQAGSTIATLIRKREDRKTIALWNNRGESIQSFPLVGKFDDITFIRKDRLIVTRRGPWDNRTFQLWKIEDDRLTRFHPNEKFNDVTFSSDGKLIATYSGEEKSVKLWTLEGKAPQPLLSEEKFNDVTFSSDGKLIATYSGEEKSVKLWTLEGKAPQPLFPDATFYDVRFSNGSKLIATSSKDSDNQQIDRKHSDSQEANREELNNQTVQLWVRDDEKLRSVPAKELDSSLSDKKLDSLKFSPNGELIAAFKGNTATFWKLVEGKVQPVRGEIKLDLDPYNSQKNVAFSPDNQLIATVDPHKVLQLWNRKGQELANLNLNDSIQQMNFSPDSKILAISRENKAPILWHLKRDRLKLRSEAKLAELVNQACKRVGSYLKNNARNEDDTLCDDN